MRLPLYQVDAFSDRLFGGNPAAVCPLERWPSDALLQSVAAENNLSETAFFVAADAGIDLRWFTPIAEVDLCGHATLAAAFVLYDRLGYDRPEIEFRTRSGSLFVTQAGGGRLSMDFPSRRPLPIPAPPALAQGLGAEPDEVLAADDYVAVFATEEAVLGLAPDFRRLGDLDRRGVLATAPGTESDFVTRCFFPGLGVDEDPVTGSAHCELAPYWAERLGRGFLRSRQLSRRGGSVDCSVAGERVILTGGAVLYLEGEIRLPSSAGLDR